jgi:acyl-coenzyme A synthetase/AMP-(fatty) acid ligase
MMMVIVMVMDIVFVEDLPKSNVGKILRREIREQELKRVT